MIQKPFVIQSILYTSRLHSGAMLNARPRVPIPSRVLDQGPKVQPARYSLTQGSAGGTLRVWLGEP